MKRRESTRIVLKGNSRFYAEGVTFAGNIFIEVPENTLMIAKENGGTLVFETKPLYLDDPFWSRL